MGRYRQYSEYTQTRSEWWGQLPSHWVSARLKQLCTKITDGTHFSPQTADVGHPYVTVRDLVDGAVDTDNAEKISEEAFRALERSGCRPKRGDVLFSKDGTIGKVALVADNDFVVLSSLAILRPDEVRLTSRFLKYLLLSPNGMHQIESHFAGAALKRITLDVIVDLHVSQPPQDEQESIADFLDHETAKIDRLIARQERLIELLKEKRQAVISHAVTKGLNPNASMKDSGVEWLGEVPAHWDTAQVRHVVRFYGGGTPSKDNEKYWEGDIPWVSPKDMKRDFIVDSQDKITEEAVSESSTKIIPAGAVLIVVRGMILLHSVPVGLAERDVTLNQDMKALVPGSRISGRYLLYLLKGLKSRILELVDSSAHGTRVLPMEEFARLALPVPPLEDQAGIVAAIEQKLDRLEATEKRAADMVALLQEHRTALISAAVTGKIDVRGWQKSKNESQEAATAANA